VARKTKRVRVDRSDSPRYASVGQEFTRAAELAQEFVYWTAAGLLMVHASIAYADAVAIRLAGLKSTSDDHLDAVTLLAEAAAEAPDRDPALQHLRRIIDEKNRVAYSGDALREREVTALATHATRFRTWAMKILEA